MVTDKLRKYLLPNIPYARIHTTEIQRIADYGISQGKEQFNDLRKVCKSQV